MRVLVSAWAIGRDAGSVGGRDAGEFRPERFFIVNANGMLSNNVDVKGQDRELLPFWVGSQDVLCRGVELQDLSMEEKYGMDQGCVPQGAAAGYPWAQAFGSPLFWFRAVMHACILHPCLSAPQHQKLRSTEQGCSWLNGRMEPNRRQHVTIYVLSYTIWDASWSRHSNFPPVQSTIIFFVMLSRTCPVKFDSWVDFIWYVSECIGHGYRLSERKELLQYIHSRTYSKL